MQLECSIFFGIVAVTAAARDQYCSNTQNKKGLFRRTLWEVATSSDTARLLDLHSLRNCWHITGFSGQVS